MPRRRKLRDPAFLRDLVDLEPSAGLKPRTTALRAQLFHQFCHWLNYRLDLDISVLCMSGLLLGLALKGFGKELFYGGYPFYLFAETLNCLLDKFRHHKAYFSESWALLSRWGAVEPSERRFIIPESVLMAAVAVAISWNWPRFAACLLLCFHGILRPGEVVGAIREHLILPADLLSKHKIAYLRINSSKTSRFMLRQHAKVDDPLVVDFLIAIFGKDPLEKQLFGSCYSSFTRRWQAVFRQIGIPVSEASNGVTPGCLRGSGATHLYHSTENIPLIAWRGRWLRQRTLEHYLQDVAGQLFITRLPPKSQILISDLAKLAPAAMRSIIQLN